MATTRRDVLKAAGVVAGGAAFPVVFRGGTAFAAADPATRLRRRLVVLFLAGGNDGLNTVVPMTDVAGHASRTVYDRVRSIIGIPAANVLPLNRTTTDADHGVGLNPGLPYLKSLYDAGRLAIVQGVDYPGHNYSHFNSTDFWQSGQPQETVTSGWLGRHLDRVGIAPTEMRAVALGSQLPLVFRGEPSSSRTRLGVAFDSIGGVRFIDGANAGAEANARHLQFASYGNTGDLDAMRRLYGGRCKQANDLVNEVAALPGVPYGGTYFANHMLNARAMLESPLGVEVVFVGHYSGYDTHSNQVAHHANLMTELDQGIEAFYNGTRGGVAIAGSGPMASDIADRTTIMVWSEFGRTLGDNGSGTDHGAAAPVFLVGPPPPAPGSGTTKLMPGLHGEHPLMGSSALPASDLAMTTDVRRIYQALLTQWLQAPGEPYYDAKGITELPGLFGTA